ncbi:MAG: glycosyltransferase family 2 protein, partial [Betaproteobacteria bacterium]
MSAVALITNYETWPLTLRCVDALLGLSEQSLTRIIIVDDASTGAPPKLPAKVAVVSNPVNVGYVASVTVGFSRVEEDVVVLLDSDAYPLMDVVSPLFELFVANPRLGAIGFHAVDGSGAPTGSWETEPSVADLVLGQRLSAAAGRWSLVSHSRGKIGVFSSGMAIRSAAFRDVGGFDEGFEFLDADLDFSLRLQDKDWEVRPSQDLRVLHTGGGSPQETSRRVIRFHINRWRLLSKRNRIPAPLLVCRTRRSWDGLTS